MLPVRQDVVPLFVSSKIVFSKAMYALFIYLFLSLSLAGRGPIVTNYVTDYLSNAAYSQRLVDNDDMYNAFNFVSVEFR